MYTISNGAESILKTLNSAGYEAYLVGGCVRDMLRGAVPDDWDICTSARPEEVEACFQGQRTFGTGLRHGTVTVLENGERFEVTTFRTDGAYTDGRRPDAVNFVKSLTEDLARRDFTVNAIAMGLNRVPIDPFGGLSDISEGVLRCVGDPERRFREDGLRVMRALRFASTLNYTLTDETADAVHRNAAMLRCVASERIEEELTKLLCGGAVGRVLRSFPDVLWQFWPELRPLVTMHRQCTLHCSDGWEHTVRAVEAARPEVSLRLTMLLHDVGKPLTSAQDADGLNNLHDYAGEGAELAKAMLRRLHYKSGTVKTVTELLRLHGTPVPTGPKALRHLIGELGESNFFLLLEVKRAETMALSGEYVKSRLKELDAAEAAARELLAQRPCLKLRDLAVNGRDVIGAGVRQGPEVGQILSALFTRVTDGELPNDREALLTELKRMAENKGKAKSR